MEHTFYPKCHSTHLASLYVVEKILVFSSILLYNLPVFLQYHSKNFLLLDIYYFSATPILLSFYLSLCILILLGILHHSFYFFHLSLLILSTSLYSLLLLHV